jgi:transposase InsO family protein
LSGSVNASPVIVVKAARLGAEVERFIKTLQAEWAYAMPFNSSEERKRWLPRYLAIDNGRRCHMAIGGSTPIQQLNRLRVTE